MTVDTFPGLPPFPEDVPTIELAHISYHKLQACDAAEVEHLFQACKDWGFFYLDLRDSTYGPPFLTLVDEVLDIGKKLFELDLEKKNKYRMAKTIFDG